MHLGERLLGRNQWYAWPTVTASTDASASGIASALPASASASGTTRSSSDAHRVAGLDGDDGRSERDELPRQLARAGGEVENTPPRSDADPVGEPAQRVVGVRRPRALVLLGDRLEAEAVEILRHGSTGQRSTMTQSSQRGLRASQTRRPCQIIRCGNRAQSRARDELHEVALDLHRILLLRQPEPLREPAHVRVDDDALRVAELGRDDVRSLARDAGEPHELRKRPSAPAPSNSSISMRIVPRSDFAFWR